LDNWHGPLEAAAHWSVVALSIAASLWAWDQLPVAPAACVYLLALVVVGGRQRAISGLLHQASHGTLMANRTAGRVLGSVVGGYPVLQSYGGYRRSHVRDHHGSLGDPERDPDYLQYRHNGLCGPDLVRESVRRHLLTLATPRSTWSYVAYLVRHRIWSREEEARERVVRIVLLVVVVGGAAWSGWLGLLVAYWFVPLVTTQVWIGGIAELWEHYPLIESAPRVDIYMSWNRELGLPARLVLGETKGEGYHLAHHLFPRTPFWRLEEVDEILARDPAYASLPRLRGFVPAISTMVSSVAPRASV
jgi:fatty acid desaturase